MEEESRKVSRRDEIMKEKIGKILSIREILVVIGGGEYGRGSRELNEGDF